MNVSAFFYCNRKRCRNVHKERFGVFFFTVIEDGAETFIKNVSAFFLYTDNRKRCRSVLYERFSVLFNRKWTETFFMNVSAFFLNRKRCRNVLYERFGVFFLQ